MVAFKNIIQNSTEMFISLVNTNWTLFSTKYFGIHRCKSSDPCLLSRTHYILGSGYYKLVAQLVKNPPAVWEIRILSLGLEDTLEKGMAPHSSILAWRILMDKGAWRATVHGVTKSQT